MAFQADEGDGKMTGGKNVKKASKQKVAKSQKEIDKELRRYFDRGRVDDFDDEYVKTTAEQHHKKGANKKRKGRKAHQQSIGAQDLANANPRDEDSVEDKEDAKFEALLRDYNNEGKRKK